MNISSSTKDDIMSTLERIKKHSGVEYILILNNEGKVIYSSSDQHDSKTYADVITKLTTKARSVVRDLQPQNDLTFLRMRTKGKEFLIAPEKDYVLIVVQKMIGTNE